MARGGKPKTMPMPMPKRPMQPPPAGMAPSAGPPTAPAFRKGGKVKKEKK